MCENSPKKETLKFGSRESIFLIFFPIFWSTWTGNHPKEDLAKFGYSIERQYLGKKGKESLLHFGEGDQILAISLLIFSKSFFIVVTMEIF
jgi:hypothetical protein